MVNLGKLVIFVFLLSSCSVLDSVPSILNTSREIGKLEGRAEVLEALKANKQDLNVLKKKLAHTAVDMTLEETASEQELLGISLMLVSLLKERRELKKKLKDAPLITSE